MIDLYDSEGNKSKKITLDKKLFEAKINIDLMHRAVVRKLSNSRKNIAHTQTRGEVRATTKKAFRQKGTGRARRGAMTTTLLRGGAPSHGPRNNRNFVKNMPKKERRQALFSALSAKAKDKAFFAFAGMKDKTPCTKKLAKILAKFPEAKKYLFITTATDDTFSFSLSNIPNTELKLANFLHPCDLLKADQICFVGDSLDMIKKTFL